MRLQKKKLLLRQLSFSGGVAACNKEAVYRVLIKIAVH